MEAEFGMPQWGFGMSSYAFESAERIVCSYVEKEFLTSLYRYADKRFTAFRTCPYTDIRYVRAARGQAVMRAASPTESRCDCQRSILDTRQIRSYRAARIISISIAATISIPQPIEFPTEDGLTAHAFFYPPANRDFRAPEGELPPLLVQSHGGPTAAATTALSLSIQYWTSRGIAVLDVNYGGSTGFGRELSREVERQVGNR